MSQIRFLKDFNFTVLDFNSVGPLQQPATFKAGYKLEALEVKPSNTKENASNIKYGEHEDGTEDWFFNIPNEVFELLT